MRQRTTGSCGCAGYEGKNMLADDLERCADFIMGEITLRSGESPPDEPKLLRDAAKKLREQDGQLRQSFGYGNDSGCPPWMK